MELDNRLSLADSRQSAPVAVDDTQRVPVESKFLVRGAATDVWLAPSTDIHGRKHVIKIFRVDLRTLQDHCNPRGPRTAEQLWFDFIQTLRLKVEIWEALRHDNIVGFLGIHEEPDLRVEFCDNGTASQYLEKHSDDHIRLRKLMILDLLAAIVYLHSQKPPVVHGCICMDKLLVDNQGRTKISEFGLASLVEEFGLFAPSISQSNRTRWLSPELLDTDADEQPPICTTESDMWALGCTLFEITSGKLPYFKLKHDLRVQREILSKKLPGRQDSCLAPEFVLFWPLLAQCWSWAPEQRPVADSPDNSILFLLSTERIPPEQVRESTSPGIPPPSDAQAEVFTSYFSNDISNIVVAEPTISASLTHPVMMDPFLPVSISEKSLSSSYSTWQPPPLEEIGTFPWALPGAGSIEPDIEHAYHVTRDPSARTCIGCRRLKLRCRLDSQGTMTCERCRASGLECRFQESKRGKKPKSAAVPSDLTENSSDEGQEVIPMDKGKSRAELRPLGSQKQSEDTSILEPEVLYPGPTVGPEVISEGQAVPKILALRIITDEEAEHLFQIFHQKLDPSIGIIDPRIHSMTTIKSRSEILFTAICAIASRYWTARPEAYTMLMSQAKMALVQAFINGPQSIELCQALLLLSLYHPPTQKREDDQSWFYLGYAIRLAQDLQLDTWDLGESDRPEVLNGARTWLLCLKVDGELANFHGQPAAILNNRITQNPSDWWTSPKYDVQLCDDTRLSLVTTYYWSLVYADSDGLGEFDNDAIFRSSILDDFDNDLNSLNQRVERANSIDTGHSILSLQYRATLMRLKIAYHRLRISSFRLETAHQSVSESRGVILSQSFNAASEVLRITNEDMLTHEFYRYAPNIDWIPSLHTAIFLIKLARPRNPRPSELTISQVQREEALSLIRKFIFTLEMNAVDAWHTLAVYARLLAFSLGEHEGTTMGDAPDADTLSFASGLENLGWEVSLSSGISTLNGGFWDNFLLPGMIWLAEARVTDSSCEAVERVGKKLELGRLSVDPKKMLVIIPGAVYGPNAGKYSRTSVRSDAQAQSTEVEKRAGL